MLYNELQIKGLTTELKCINKFIECGFIVSIPYGNNARYDFIVDDGKNIYRIQAKTSRLENGHYVFCTSNTMSNTKTIIRKFYSKEDIDFFCTLTENDELLLIPVEDCENKSDFTIFFENSKFSTGKHLISRYYFTGEFTEYIPWEPILPPPKIKTKRKIKTEEEKKKERTCPMCGKEKAPKASMCRLCFETKKMNLNREEYKQGIRNKSMNDFAEELGITPRVLRKKLARRNIPTNKKEINSYSDEEWAKL